MRRLSRPSSKWDQHHLDRNQRVLQVWDAPATEKGQLEAAALRQAIATADSDTLEHHGGLDAVMEKIHQAVV